MLLWLALLSSLFPLPTCPFLLLVSVCRHAFTCPILQWNETKHTHGETPWHHISLQSLSDFSASCSKMYLYELSLLAHLCLLLSPLRFDTDFTVLSELHILLISRSLIAFMLMNLVDSSLDSHLTVSNIWHNGPFLCESSFSFCDTTYSYGCSFSSFSFSKQPLNVRILRAWSWVHFFSLHAAPSSSTYSFAFKYRLYANGCPNLYPQSKLSFWATRLIIYDCILISQFIHFSDITNLSKIELLGLLPQKQNKSFISILLSGPTIYLVVQYWVILTFFLCVSNNNLSLL